MSKSVGGLKSLSRALVVVVIIVVKKSGNDEKKVFSSCLNVAIVNEKKIL
jgi:hypothetical protein